MPTKTPDPDDRKIPWPPKTGDWKQIQALVEEANARTAQPQVVNRGDWVEIPKRRPKEAVVSWVARCSQAMINAALQVAERDDADLLIAPTESGAWLIQHRNTGQQVVLRATQVPGRG